MPLVKLYLTHKCTCNFNGAAFFCIFILILWFSSPADDHQALIWDIQQMPRAIEDPILAYTAAGEINQIQWSSTQPDWIAICYNNCLEILRVWDNLKECEDLQYEKQWSNLELDSIQWEIAAMKCKNKFFNSVVRKEYW